MKIKTSNLTGVALDWAVAKALGCELTTTHAHYRNAATYFHAEEKVQEQLEKLPNYACYIDTIGNTHPIPAYSTNWFQCGLIIQRENITVQTDPTDNEPEGWSAYHRESLFNEDGSHHWQNGPTPLIAACRCYVASKLGDEVEVPDELL